MLRSSFPHQREIWLYTAEWSLTFQYYVHNCSYNFILCPFPLCSTPMWLQLVDGRNISWFILSNCISFWFKWQHLNPAWHQRKAVRRPRPRRLPRPWRPMSARRHQKKQKKLPPKWSSNQSSFWDIGSEALCNNELWIDKLICRMCRCRLCKRSRVWLF